MFIQYTIYEIMRSSAFNKDSLSMLVNLTKFKLFERRWESHHLSAMSLLLIDIGTTVMQMKKSKRHFQMSESTGIVMISFQHVRIQFDTEKKLSYLEAKLKLNAFIHLAIPKVIRYSM